MLKLIILCCFYSYGLHESYEYNTIQKPQVVIQNLSDYLYFTSYILNQW